MEVELQSSAKINLALDVLGERDDGYHDIDTIMQEIDLFDVITIEPGRGGFVLTCDNPDLPLDEDNLVYRAWDLLREKTTNDSVNINIKKRIPIAAGLAGGSSNAASTLIGLNKLWDLELSTRELEQIAESIGSDVPFFIQGGTQRARGRGEILQPLTGYRGRFVLLVNIGQPISSRYVYEHVKVNGSLQMDELVRYMDADSPKAYSLMQNQLETVSFEAIPRLKEIKNEILQLGANVALMSGSGPTVFGLFESKEPALQAEKAMKGRFPLTFMTTTI